MGEQDFSSEIRFSRELGLWRAIALSLGVMLTLLIFVLMGGAVAAAGPVAPLAYLLAALLLLANVLGYVELAVTLPRPGGAYALVREAQGGWLAFLTGWMLTLSGLGVCALLAQGFAVQVVTLLNDHLGLALPIWPWAAGLVILLAVNNGLGTQESQRGRVTILLIAVLLGFTLLAAPRIELAHYVVARPDWGQALTLLMVSFVGLEITAGLLGEIRQREANAPRALLLVPLLVAVFGAIIVAVTVGVVGSAPLADSGVPLALLGASVAGGAGRPLILVLGGLALALALNRTLMMVVRQIYKMSADGFWPAGLRRTQPRFRTPALLIALVALLLLPLALLPVDFLARLTGLLYLLVLMGVNLALFRRPQQGPSSFTLPFHPWVPGLTLAVDVLIALLWGSALSGLGVRLPGGRNPHLPDLCPEPSRRSPGRSHCLQTATWGTGRGGLSRVGAHRQPGHGRYAPTPGGHIGSPTGRRGVGFAGRGRARPGTFGRREPQGKSRTGVVRTGHHPGKGGRFCCSDHDPRDPQRGPGHPGHGPRGEGGPDPAGLAGLYPLLWRFDGTGH